VVWCGLLALPAAGCGLVLAHGPPADHQQLDTFHCTRSNSGPIIDVALAGLSALAAVAAADQWGEFGDYYYYVSDEVTVAGVAAAGLYSVSAYIGFRRTSRCRAAMDLLQRRHPVTVQDGAEKSPGRPMTTGLARVRER
jgi:hypothetical protein